MHSEKTRYEAKMSDRDGLVEKDPAVNIPFIAWAASRAIIAFSLAVCVGGCSLSDHSQETAIQEKPEKGQIKSVESTENATYPKDDYEVEFQDWIISFRSRAGYEDYKDYGSIKIFGSEDGAVAFSYVPGALSGEPDFPRTAEEFLSWEEYSVFDDRKAWNVEAGDAAGYKCSYSYSDKASNLVNYTVKYELFCGGGDLIKMETSMFYRMPPDIENVTVRKK